MLLGLHLKELGFENIKYEYKFDPSRRYRADICLEDDRILIELDGGVYAGGHRRGASLIADYERQNRAILAGWRLLRFANITVLRGEAKAFLAEHLTTTNSGVRK
jgi:very-short-patch-repair endonuclease